MNQHRRQLLKASVAAALFPALVNATAEAAPLSEVTGIRIIQDSNPMAVLQSVSAPGFTESLSRAVYGFVLENYATGNLPVWKLPLSQVDLSTRISAISEQVVRSVQIHSRIYPVDPCWLMGQIMAESFFNEFAVSSALAVGVCQFIPATARQYKMICADQHLSDPSLIRRADLEQDAKRAPEYQQQMKDLRANYKDLFNKPEQTLRSVLSAMLSGQPFPQAASYSQAFDLMDLLKEQYTNTRNSYKQYLQANFQGRSIFAAADIRFFEKFEQRVLYPYAVDAMVKLMADLLRGRNGNILAATAGYNAGPGRTDYPTGVYSLYGRVPDISETADYVSKILINHHEITRRM